MTPARARRPARGVSYTFVASKANVAFEAANRGAHAARPRSTFTARPRAHDGTAVRVLRGRRENDGWGRGRTNPPINTLQPCLPEPSPKRVSNCILQQFSGLAGASRRGTAAARGPAHRRTARLSGSQSGVYKVHTARAYAERALVYATKRCWACERASSNWDCIQSGNGKWNALSQATSEPTEAGRAGAVPCA